MRCTPIGLPCPQDEQQNARKQRQFHTVANKYTSHYKSFEPSQPFPASVVLIRHRSSLHQPTWGCNRQLWSDIPSRISKGIGPGLSNKARLGLHARKKCEHCMLHTSSSSNSKHQEKSQIVRKALLYRCLAAFQFDVTLHHVSVIIIEQGLDVGPLIRCFPNLNRPTTRNT